jgi:sporulation protein YlmC with PRC-barrel domain
MTMTTIDDTSLDVISSDKVEGASVYSPDGEKLGSIDDLMIDKLSGQVRYAVLEFGGFLGMGTDRFPMPWRVLAYSHEHGGYVVPLAKAALEKAPRYHKADVPRYDERYGNTVETYYRQY